MLTIKSTPASLAAMRKPRGSLKQSGTNRIDKIGTLRALECRAHTLKVEQVISIPKIQSVLRALTNRPVGINVGLSEQG